MTFELKVALDKIKESEIDNIKKQITKLSKLKIYDKKNIKEKLYGHRLIFSYEAQDNCIYLTLEIHGTYDKEILLAIYNVFSYLETLATSQKYWSIKVKYFVSYTKENSFNINIEETLKWDYASNEKLEIINLFKTIANRSNNDYNFKEFQEKLESDKKYEHILKNIETYKKRKIPNVFSEPVVKKFGNASIIMSSKCHYIENFFKALKYKDIDITIIDEYKVNYKYINTDLSTTKLFKYTAIDKDENLFYILEDCTSSGDDCASRLYFFTNEIEDEDLQKIIKPFDK